MKGWTFAFLATLVACTPARKKVRGDIVRDIAFTGNGSVYSGHNDYQLRTQLEQEESALGALTWPLSLVIEPKLLQPDALVRDAYRLEVWYAHHGWFDARFGGWTIDRVRRATRRKAGVVDVRGFIDTGPRSTVRTLDVTGADGAAGLLARAVLRTGYLRQGDPFDLDTVENARLQLETQLQKSGYAYADVELAMDAYPEEQAVDVVLDATPGLSARLGAITIQGNDKVPERFIRDALDLEAGRPYRLDELLRAQNRVFGMDTFSLVSVQPDLSDPTQERVPISVSVTENKFRSLRFGGGLEAEGTVNWQPYVSAGFKHTNVFRQLIQFDANTQVGVSGYSPLNTSSSNPTPVWSVSTSLLYPRLFHQTVAQQLQVDVERDLDTSLQEYFKPQVDFRSIFKPSDAVIVSVGPHLEIVQYPNLEPGSIALERARSVYGEDFESEYRITSMDLGFTLDWRDDRLSTKRGSFFNTNLRLAFPLEEGDFSFAALSGDWRLFRPIKIGDRVPLTLATRVQGRGLLAIGESGLPYPELAFFGGSASMRGFPTGGMGPYDLFLLEDDDPTWVPVGGTLGGVLSEELRYYGSYGITYALFAEAGTLTNPGRDTETPFIEQALDGLRLTGGIGMRYDSSIGPLRIDFALRPWYPEDCGPRSNPDACEDENAKARRLDLIRTFDRDSRFPGVMVMFAFGEAI